MSPQLPADYSKRAGKSSFRDRLIRLPRGVKQLLMIGADTIGVIGCLGLCVWLHLITPVSVGDLALLLTTSVVITVLLARHLGFYHSIVRYLGMGLVLAGAKVAISAAVMLAVVAAMADMSAEPLKLAVVFAAFCGLYLVGSRYLAQFLLLRRVAGSENVIVFGAGHAGARVVQTLEGSPLHSVVALIDDDPRMQGKVIGGVPVFPRSDIERLISEQSVTRVLLAIPSVSRHARAAIIAELEPLAVHVQTIPDLNDIISGKAKVGELREVGVEDLLGRDAVEPNAELMKTNIAGKSVMVTGAGGSIGAELCRAIILSKPARLVLFDISEVALYTIDKELCKLSEKLGLGCEIVAILGTVGNQRHVQEVMLSFHTDTVYHAAAYKHVPVVERNMLAGVDNNVFGTLSTARAAVAAKVDTFVLVSTDKAVSPPNVMGATKRVAELILQAMQDEHPGITFCMVRFGNVLESSGSVVPLFREQIQHGGPVTVTHPEIIRYFMTIPEAAQLVIQAGAMAKGGDVFVLDMGQPVQILDLAHRLIHLMGLTVRDSRNPEGDIEVVYTGLRPAEKLYEELLIGDNATGTSHPRIMRAHEDYIPHDALQVLLGELAACSERRDRFGARELLKRVVEGYQPSNGIDDHLWDEEQSAEAQVERKVENKVVNLNRDAGHRPRPGSAKA